MDNIKELLPIGSVVLLNNGKKRVMIFGVKQSDVDTKIEYDYIGVLYPEGNVGANSQFLFNHDNIKEVCFKGFEDEERAGFIDALDKFYTNNK